MTAFCCSAMLVVTMLLVGSAQAAVGSSTGSHGLGTARHHPVAGMRCLSHVQGWSLAVLVHGQVKAGGGQQPAAGSRSHGPGGHVAATLRRLRAARESGAAESEVRRMARSALERGDLMVRPGPESGLRGMQVSAK